VGPLEVSGEARLHRGDPHQCNHVLLPRPLVDELVPPLPALPAQVGAQGVYLLLAGDEAEPHHHRVEPSVGTRAEAVDHIPVPYPHGLRVRGELEVEDAPPQEHDAPLPNSVVEDSTGAASEKVLQVPRSDGEHLRPPGRAPSRHPRDWRLRQKGAMNPGPHLLQPGLEAIVGDYGEPLSVLDHRRDGVSAESLTILRL